MLFLRQSHFLNDVTKSTTSHQYPAYRFFSCVSADWPKYIGQSIELGHQSRTPVIRFSSTLNPNEGQRSSACESDPLSTRLNPLMLKYNEIKGQPPHSIKSCIYHLLSVHSRSHGHIRESGSTNQVRVCVCVRVSVRVCLCMRV